MSCQLIKDLGTSKDGKRTPFYWVFLLLSGLRAEERPTFAQHSQFLMAHLSARHLLQGQGVPQLEHIQEKPWGERQSWTNLLMCTCTCMWKGAFWEEVCLSSFIKKYISLFVSSFIQCGVWCSPLLSISLPVPGEPFVLNSTPTPCHCFHILLCRVFSVWTFGKWNLLEHGPFTRGFTPEEKDSSCPSYW